MKKVLNNLPENDYIRVRNSSIVRIEKIIMIKRGNCIVNKKNIPISRPFYQNLLNKIKIIAP